MQGSLLCPLRRGERVVADDDDILSSPVAQDVLTPSLDRAMVDRTVAPDPHPPKQFELTYADLANGRAPSALDD